MEHNYKPKMLNNLGWYFRRALKFYDIKVDLVAPVAFLLVLAVNFICNYFFVPDISGLDKVTAEDVQKIFLMLSKSAFVYFINIVLVSVFSSIYLCAYIKDLKGEEYRLKDILLTVTKNIHKLLLLYFTLYAAYPVLSAIFRLSPVKVLVVFSLFIPFAIGMIALFVMLVFSNCYILDKGNSLKNAYESSSKMTKGHKIEIFSLILLFMFGATILSRGLTSVVLSFLPSTTSNMIILFVYAFIISMFNLMESRLIALVYMDLEY